ncbi:ComF family protein [Dyadobacter crusticola]|uniref:ComF family protein n=1 Tax=Dyadobacter crusticola TaxID=292407 RepID=UPI0004E0C3F2|nr:ComF family protein [Dyadobacter crusticola]
MLNRFFRDLLDLIFPRCCAGCDKPLIGTEQTLCTVCRISLPRIGLKGLQKDVLQNKFVNEPAVVFTHSFLLFTKKGKVQKLLHALKYRGNQEVGLVLGEMFGQEMKDAEQLSGVDLIISVPLHARKRKSRGYNQSDLLAAGFSKATGIPWSASALKRLKFTETQTGKNKIERRDNVKGVFAADTDLKASKVIIMDDVLTTGATLEECVQTLTNAGCRKFVILTIALAQH